MMSPELNNFFNAFGKETPGITLPATNTIEQNVVALAEHYQAGTEPGHGMFFDFSQTPELEKPLLDYLIKEYKWTLEKPYFIRKPN